MVVMGAVSYNNMSYEERAASLISAGLHDAAQAYATLALAAEIRALREVVNNEAS